MVVVVVVVAAAVISVYPKLQISLVGNSHDAYRGPTPSNLLTSLLNVRHLQRQPRLCQLYVCCGRAMLAAGAASSVENLLPAGTYWQSFVGSSGEESSSRKSSSTTSLT